MLVCIGFLSTLTATIASSSVSQDTEEGQASEGGLGVFAALRRIEQRLDRLETPR